MNITPKVSVVICTFNGETFLKEQLDSIFAQTYPLYEVIIRDDCSTDHTWNIIEQYCLRYPVLIKCFRNDHNIGYWLNFKLGILQAQGDYIAFSDQDDIWMPNKIETLLHVIGKKMLAISNSKILDKSLSNRDSLFQQKDIYSLSIYKLIWENKVYGHSCMINAGLVSFINAIPVDTAHDYLIALISFSINSVAYTTQELQIWRRHTQALTNLSQINKTRQIKRMHGYKVIYAIFSLMFNHKSSIILNGWDRISQILQVLQKDAKEIPHFNDLIRISKLMKKQSLLSYMKASFLCWKLKAEIFDYKKYGLRNKILVFTFVFRWWYDHRFDMS